MSTTPLSEYIEDGITDIRFYPEGFPTVSTGDYKIPNNENWIEIDGKYLVDFDEVVHSQRQALIKEVEELAVKEYSYTDCGNTSPECHARCDGHPVVVSSTIPVEALNKIKGD